MKEKINLFNNVSGIIRVDIVDRSGRIVGSHTDHNMIFYSIRDSMGSLIVGDNIESKAIRQVAIGTNGNAMSNDADDFIATDPANKYMKDLVLQSWTFPDFGQVTVNFQINYQEPEDPMEVQEYGLFTGEGKLIARAIKPLINKTDEISIIGAWTITFS